MLFKIPEITTSLHYRHSQKARDEAVKIAAWFEVHTKGRKLIKWYTIDHGESLDLDDGISARKKPDGWYIVYISITDMASIIPLNSYNFEEGLERATSIYYNTDPERKPHVGYMFHPIFATDIGSLNDKQKRYTLTMEVHLDESFWVVHSDLYPSVFFNKNRFSHETFSESFMQIDNPENEELRLFYEISQGLKWASAQKDRMNSWESRSIIIWDKCFFQPRHLASQIVEQFMILGNIEVSKWLIKNDINGIMRNHMPHLKWYTDLVWATENATYDEEMYYHFWLWTDRYCHFTSTGRRAGDFIINYIINYFLQGRGNAFTKEQVREVCEYLNLKLTSIIWMRKQYAREIYATRWARQLKRENIEIDPSMILQKFKHDIKENRLPSAIRELIIKLLESDDTFPEWVLRSFIGNGEKEIIKALKARVLKDKKVMKFMRIIENTREFRFEEELKVWRKYLSLSIAIFKWAQMIWVVNKKEEKALSPRSGKPLSSKFHHDARKEALSYLFDYCIEN